MEKAITTVDEAMTMSPSEIKAVINDLELRFAILSGILVFGDPEKISDKASELGRDVVTTISSLAAAMTAYQIQLNL